MRSLRTAPCVVTGGAGFLGQVVVRELLAAGCPEVRSLDLNPAVQWSRRVKSETLDLRSGDLTRWFRGADTVLHLAGCQYHSPLAESRYELPFDAVNVEGTRRVVAAAVECEVRRLVFVSTNMVYGPARCLPVPEAHPRCPIGPYGRSKVAAEDLVEAARAHGIETVIIRPGLLVGPGRAGVMARIFDWILSDNPVWLIGGGDNRYELIDVEDCASLVVNAGAAGVVGAYNCGSRSVPTMRSWIETIIGCTGSRSKIVPLPARPAKLAFRALETLRVGPLRADQYEIADLDYFMDVSAARRDLGWEPRWSGEEAALHTFDWYVRTRYPWRLDGVDVGRTAAS